MKNRRHVLIAEDDRLILYTIAEGLREAGYTVTCASDGEEAWQVFMNAPADLALVDIRMPRMDGIALAKRLREFSDIPIVFLTAFDDQELVTNAIELGATSYLVKPVTVQQILPVLALVLNQYATTQQLKEKALNLETALRQDKEISVAVGILRERLKVSEAEAFEFLRQKARHQRRKVLDLAREIVLPP